MTRDKDHKQNTDSLTNLTDMAPDDFGKQVDPSTDCPPMTTSHDSQDSFAQDTETQTRQALNDLQDQFIRLAADFDNFRKRSQKEKADLLHYGNEKLLRELLPIVDNFERAVEHAAIARDIDSIRTGVRMILSQLMATLDAYGLKQTSALGQAFNPLFHEAVSHVCSDSAPANTVIEEYQKGYMLHDRLLRAATVSVAKEPDDKKNGEGQVDQHANPGHDN